MLHGFTIKIFVPDGDPDGVRIVERMNWTGMGTVIPRQKWPLTKMRGELAQAGVYILMGWEDEDRPTIYIGEGDSVGHRIESHYKKKMFWDQAIIFTAGNRLNKAYVKWLEYALVQRAKEAARCTVENDNEPRSPALSEAELADVSVFLDEALQILPIVRFAEYVDRTKNPYDIEHIWADDFSPYADQFVSQQEFQDWRNHVAGLLLLPADVNRSLQAKPFSAKAPHYAKQNLYAASLTDSTYQHQPQFAQFRQRTELPFKPYATFGKAQQEERRALVHAMVQWIWAPDRIQDAVR